MLLAQMSGSVAVVSLWWLLLPLAVVALLIGVRVLRRSGRGRAQGL